VAEKYLQLARDAQSSGDPVLAENYLQHAEHYFRIVAAGQPQQRDQFGQSVEQQEDDDDFPPINDRFASPEPPQQFRPQPQPGEQPSFGNEGDDGAEPPVQQAQPVAAQSGEQVPAEDGQQANGPQGEGPDGRRHRDRNRRRRGRGPGEGGQGGADPAAAPQPDVGELPAFLTAGGPTTVAE
jgi:hypothetical protein